MVNGMCQSPEHLKNIPIWNIQGGGLTCGSSYKIPNCQDFVGSDSEQTVPTPTARTTALPPARSINNLKFTKVSETDNAIEIWWQIRSPSMISSLKLEYQKLGPYPTIYPIQDPQVNPPPCIFQIGIFFRCSGDWHMPLTMYLKNGSFLLRS
jgi:hypothetical protein